MTKDIKQLQGAKLKKRAAQKPSRTKAPPVLFERLGIFSQRQCRATLARILKLLLNGELPESRVREARWVVQSAMEINRELSLRARLDLVCEHLKIDPVADDEDEAPLPEEEEDATD